MILGWMAEARRDGARLAPACRELGLDTRTVQRWRRQGDGDDMRNGPKTTPSNKLGASEREELLRVANSPEFRNLSPKQIVPKLADQKKFIASESTFYRVLREEKQMAHRGRAAAPQTKPPAEHSASGPRQVWSWDITYLRSPVAGLFFYLYLFVDVWSRKIVGQKVFSSESTDLASELIQQSLCDEGIDGVGLVSHSDNGSPMKGATLKATMERLGVIASYSRPGVSDDNPFSESLFRTLKYRPNYPGKPFESIEAAQAWVDDFVAWYNNEHLHSGIGFTTPVSRHDGRADAVLESRREVYEAARRRRPERWARGAIRAWSAPATVTLNPTIDRTLKDQQQSAAA